MKIPKKSSHLKRGKTNTKMENADLNDSIGLSPASGKKKKGKKKRIMFKRKSDLHVGTTPKNMKIGSPTSLN